MPQKFLQESILWRGVTYQPGLQEVPEDLAIALGDPITLSEAATVPPPGTSLLDENLLEQKTEIDAGANLNLGQPQPTPEPEPDPTQQSAPPDTSKRTPKK